MRLAQCVASALLVTAAFIQAALPQEEQEIDRTDPVAVAQAYVRACDAGDRERAVGLLAGEATRRGLRALIELGLMRSAQQELVSLLTDQLAEMHCLPMGMPLERQVADTTVQDDTANVAFKAAHHFDQKVVLRRQGDGTWAVDLIESLRATTGKQETFVLEALADLWEGGYSHVSAEARLRRLWRAVEEYVTDHDGKLPPAERWVDEVELYVLDRSLFRNPGQPDLEYGFAMNVEASGRGIPEFDPWDDLEEPRDFVVLFEWPTGARNACASFEEVDRLHADPQEDGMAYITAFGRVGTIPASMTWAEKQQRDREEMAKMEDEGLAASATRRCAAHLQALGQAARKYARDHGGLLPGVETWQDDLALYLLEADNEVRPDVPGVEPAEDHVLRCPAAPDLDYAYAINAEIAGKNALELTGHDKIVLFFESDLNVPNAAGLPERDKVEGGRHETYWHGEEGERGNQIVYLNGDVDWLEWSPEERRYEE